MNANKKALTLATKIDFILLILVRLANPNGNPIDGRPRTDYDDFGIISDVSIRRKIRNRMQDMLEKIFVQSEDRIDDGCETLNERAAILKDIKNKDEFAKKACETWIDVRTFGQVFANKSAKCPSVGVRGPVTIQPAFSAAPVDVIDLQITKSCSNKKDKDGTRGSDTMGSKSFVKFGLYTVKGSINVQLAEKTGFSEKDAETLKECLRTLFVNDESAARPAGSMEVLKLYWFRHDNKEGQYSSAKVHESVSVTLKPEVVSPSKVEDFDIQVTPLEGLEMEEIDGV